MAVKTKQELKTLFSDEHLVTGTDFTDLIDSLKGEQSSVSDPTASGYSVTFISNITQNEEGVVTATKKNVNFDGYMTVAGMADYQGNDRQVTGELRLDGSGQEMEFEIAHSKKHYPTVRLLKSGDEIRPTANMITPYEVHHTDIDNLVITIPAAMNQGEITFIYVLD